MIEHESVPDRFERSRPRLRAIAYRMLGSLTETEDALQEAWLRVTKAETAEIANVEGWLTTIVARVCLNMLRQRSARREQPLPASLPDPVISPGGELEPEAEILLAESVGLALQVVLGTLSPPERIAFVLHDMFALPFEDISGILGRTPAAARQLASRARRRVRDAEVRVPDPDLDRQRVAVDAFFAAGRRGDFEALVAVLDPDVVLRADGGGARRGATRVVRGAETVARQALAGARSGSAVHPVLVNGTAGAVITVSERLQVVMAFTVAGGRIAEIDVIADPRRVARLAPRSFAETTTGPVPRRHGPTRPAPARPARAPRAAPPGTDPA